MPDIVLLFIVVTGTLFIIGITLESKEPFYLFFLSVPILLVAWYCTSYNNIQPYNYGVFTVKIVDDISVIVVEDTPINLNGAFNKNIPEGTQVKVYTYQRMSEGILHTMSRSYEFEILSAEALDKEKN